MKEYNQYEGIYFDERYAPIAQFHTIRMLLVFSCIMNFKLFQMDVKIAFLNGYTQEYVFVDQLPKFINSTFSNHVFKIKKAL